MRIAVVAPPWIPVPPVSYGGTELVVDALCRGLVRLGHEVLLVATGDSTCDVEMRFRHERAVGTAHTRGEHELTHVAFGYETAAEWGADLVHDHTLIGPFFGAAAGASPVVTTVHGPIDGDVAQSLRAVAARVPLIAISHAQARLAGQLAIAAVIHHGIDVSALPVGTRRGDHAVFLGRMSADKGVDVAIDVARRAGVRLLIAAKMAEDDERRCYEELVRPRLGADVEYVGEVSRQEQLALLTGARCLLNPIRWNEPFGLAVIEALATGTPVVTTPRGAMPELVDDGVTGFVRADLDGLADGVRRAVSIDPATCRKVVEERFTMDRMARDHEAFYASVLRSRSEGRSR